MGNQHYKKRALTELEGKWGQEIGMMFIYFIVAIVGSILVKESGFKNIVYTAVTTIIYLGYTRHVLRVADKAHKFELKGLFHYFTTKEILSLIALNIVVGLLTLLWGLLFIIPGIVMGVAYSQSIYLKIENSEMRVMETIKESKEMMKGHKMEYFLLGLSFIGWYILGTITVIGLIPVSVYVQFTMVEYYKDLKTKNSVEYAGEVDLSK